MTLPNDEATKPLFLSALLRHAFIDAKGRQLGKLGDAIIRLRGHDYPLLTALVARVAGNRVFVPVSDVVDISSDRITLATAKLDLRPFARRPGEVLLRGDVLGHRLIDVDRAMLVRAHDVALQRAGNEWVVTGLDVHKHRRLVPPTAKDHHALRDWHSFEALIGHEPSALLRSPTGQLRRLRPAQIADLIEAASAEEQTELLAQVHTDPDLEADVFEELDDDSQTQLFRNKTVDEIAVVLAHMQSDAAADALIELPQERRQAVLDALPSAERVTILRLLGYHSATAGGIMGVRYVAVPEKATIRAALEEVRTATDIQPEALSTIYTITSDGVLAGALNLAVAVQADPDAPVSDVAEENPVHARPGDDLVDVITRMADFNLLALPVIGDDNTIVGLITVDNALEEAIPENWRHREPRTHPTTIDDRA